MKKILAMSVAAATLLAAVPASAHHSFAMFDPSQEVVVEGNVVRWQFSNPHTFMIIEDDDGQVWAFEGSAPAALISRGMTGTTFDVGDRLFVVQCPLRDGRPGGAAGIFITEDGTVYSPADGGCQTSRNIDNWPGWIDAGYRSLEEVEAAGAL